MPTAESSEYKPTFHYSIIPVFQKKKAGPYGPAFLVLVGGLFLTLNKIKLHAESPGLNPDDFTVRANRDFEVREKEALEWIEVSVGDSTDEKK